jgi:hypothetical protein
MIVHPLSNIISKNEMTKLPNIQVMHNLYINKPNALYTLIMYDTDAKYIHWLVINKDEEIGNTIIEYIDPNPPKGYHHYEFLLYEQKGRYIGDIKMINRKTPLEHIVKGLKLIDRKVFQSGGENRKLNNIKRYRKPIKWKTRSYSRSRLLIRASKKKKSKMSKSKMP